MPKQPSSLEALLQMIISQSAAAISDVVRDHTTATPAAAPKPTAKKPPSPVRPKKPAASPPKAAAPKPPARPSALTDNPIELLLDAITAFPGLRAEALREKVGLSPAQVTASLGKLRHQQRVSTAGKARDTTYSPIGAGSGNPAKKAARKPATPLSTNTPPAPAPKPRTWPTCSTAGCSNKFFPASGKARLCYQHFLAASGTPPLAKRK